LVSYFQKKIERAKKERRKSEGEAESSSGEMNF